MKRRLLLGLLGMWAVACVVLHLLQASFTGAFSAAVAFPFEQIGEGLRWLSLSSGFGNVVAVVLYCAISLLPIAFLFVARKRRKLRAEDGLLALLSVLLFVVLYLMINPGLISMMAIEIAVQHSDKALLGLVVYSVFCGYLILRALRLFSAGSAEKLFSYLSIMLYLLNALFVYQIFGSCFNELLTSITKLQAGNVGSEYLLPVSYFFLGLQFLVNALPYLLTVLVVFAALRLLDELRAERYSAGTVAATKRISRLCATALVIMVLANISFNLLQLLFTKSLMVGNITVEIPVLPICFVLLALLLTRLITENKRLKDDNDGFI